MGDAPDPRTDGELLVATLSDPEAFAVFYRRHVRGLLAFFRRRAGSAEAAFDLTAETFAAALEAAPRYQPRQPDDSGAARSGEAGCRAGAKPEPARGWLYGIAWNKLHEAQRRGRAEDIARRELGMQPIVLTDAGVERIEALAGGPALEMLEALPADQRDAVRGRVLEGRSYPELAAELQCSESVIRQRVSRGVRALRARVEGVRDE